MAQVSGMAATARTPETLRWVASGHSRDVDGYRAGHEAASRAVAGRQASLVLVFCSDAYDLAALQRGVNKATGGAPMVGCSTPARSPLTGRAMPAWW